MERPPRHLKQDRLVNAKLVGFSYLMVGVIQILAGIFTFHVIMGDGGLYNGGQYLATGPYGNGFPPQALWSIGENFLPQETDNYTICRVPQTVPKTTTFCSSSMAALDAFYPGYALNYSDPQSLSALMPSKVVDYCFDDPHWQRVAPTVTPGNANTTFLGSSYYGTSCRASNTIPRDLLHNAGMSGYFISVIICQWSCLFISKTRWSSIFTQGIHNTPLVLGWIFENILGLFLIYVPGVNTVFNTFPLQAIWYLCPIPFSILIFAFDEVRKFIMRRHPHGWVKRRTYY